VAFYVYILRCVDGSYYVGHTDDLQRRLAEHEQGAFPGYTRELRPVELAWCDTAPTREEALAFELRIKGWSRRKKQALIDGDWELLPAVARGRRRRLPPG
jgi:predicted GIY-YIG superfamily endonuclease